MINIDLNLQRNNDFDPEEIKRSILEAVATIVDEKLKTVIADKNQEKANEHNTENEPAAKEINEEKLIKPKINFSYILSKQILFRDWKGRVENELKYYDCLEGLRSENTSKDKKDIAASIIKNRVDDEHLRIIAQSNEPKEMINLLENYRQPRNATSDIPLRRKLNTLYYQGNEDVHEFITEYEILINDIERMSGETMTDKEKKRHFIMATEDNFPNLKNAERASKGQTTYVELRNMLIDEVQSSKEQEIRRVAHANVAKVNHPNRQLYKQTCTKCGGNYHNAESCKRTDNKKKCYSCGEFVENLGTHKVNCKNSRVKSHEKEDNEKSQSKRKFRIKRKKTIKRLKPNKKVSANSVFTEEDFENTDVEEVMVVSEQNCLSGDKILEVLVGVVEEDTGMVSLMMYEINNIVYLPFVIDSGATANFSNSVKFMSDVKELKQPKTVIGISKNRGGKVEINKIGSIRTKNNLGENFVIDNVLISENINYNLLSLKKLLGSNHEAIFRDRKLEIRNKNGNIVLAGYYHNNFWWVFLPVNNICNALVIEEENTENNKIFKRVLENDKDDIVETKKVRLDVNEEDINKEGALNKSDNCKVNENNNNVVQNKKVKVDINKKNKDDSDLKAKEDNANNTNSDVDALIENAGINIEDLEEMKRNSVRNFAEEIGMLWHKRLGHPSLSYLIIASKFIPELKNVKFTKNILGCEACILGKQTKTACKEVRHKANRPLEIVNSDVMGPIAPVSYKSNSRFIVTFIDDFSNYAKAYDMKDKAHVHLYLNQFLKEIRNELGNDARISKLRSDNGTEYQTTEMKNIIHRENITTIQSEPYTPEHNGRSERFNRSLSEKMRTILFECGLPRRFWNYAMRFIVHVYNRSPNKSINLMSPYEKLFGRKIKLKNIRNFGCIVYSKILNLDKRNELDPESNGACKKLKQLSQRGVFIGCTETGYEILIPELGRIINTKHVRFVESKVYKEIYKQQNVKEILDPVLVRGEEGGDFFEQYKTQLTPMSDENTSHRDKHENSDSVSTMNMPAEENLDGREITKEEIEKTINESYTSDDDYDITSIEVDEVDIDDSKLEIINVIKANVGEVETTTLKQALEGKNKEKWRQAVVEEFEAMNRNETWIIMDKQKLPQKASIVDSTWVLKEKDEGQNIKRFRARLAARGFKDKNVYDRTEKNAPVTKLADIRSLFSAVAKFKLSICQLDVRTAFLNGTLEKEIYMLIPEGFELVSECDRDQQILKLQKSIYGLQVSSKRWFVRFRDFILTKNFQQYKFQPCIFFWRKKEKFAILSLYVDDILIVSNCEDKICETKRELSREFEIKDLGIPKRFLGIDIEINENKTIFIHMKSYIDKMLQKFGMTECNPVKTPMVTKETAKGKSNEKRVINEKIETQFREAIGSLIYLANACRPDISVATHILSRKSGKQTDEDWVSVKRVFRYLKNTKELGLLFKGEETGIKAYVDASFGCNDDGSSITGYVIKLFGDTISWKCVKQHHVALSSAESEYSALSYASREIIAINEIKRRIYKDYSIPIIFEDNTTAIKHAKSDDVPILRHLVKVYLHYIRSLVQTKQVSLEWISTNEQLGDFFTKILGTTKFEYFRDLIMTIKEK